MPKQTKNSRTDKKPLRILFIGDIMGKPGRKAVSALLPSLRKKHKVDLVIANAENLAHGKGINIDSLTEMVKSGVDFFTSGNHIWGKTEGVSLLSSETPLVIRPSNYPPDTPGRGHWLLPLGKTHILVINLMGRVFMREHLDCPFRALDAVLSQYRDIDLSGIIVDFHAEATSEKNAMGHYADGRVSAVLGTHTHIPTADNRVLPKGTAFTSDVGMVGLRDSSIGIDVGPVIQAFLTQRPAKFDIPDHGRVVFNSVLLEIDPAVKHARSITRIQEEIDV